MKKKTLVSSLLWTKDMKPTAYMTGLSAAISRGDAAVALFCFDQLAEAPGLDYIITSVMLEQCWYLVGEWATIIKSPSRYRDFVLLMACSPTNKDASALFRLAMDGIPEEATHKELALARKVGVVSPDKGIALFERNYQKGFKRPLTDYEKLAFEFLISKAKEADFLTMKWLTLMACILLIVRGLEVPEIKTDPGKPITQLPYWCCWFGTENGDKALAAFATKTELDFATMKWYWWVMETEFVPPGKAILPNAETTEFTCLESAWWNSYINTRLDDGVIEKWMKGRKHLKKIIKDLL